MGDVAIAPIIKRAPVPELPQLMTLFGSANPPTPTPWIDQVPLLWFINSAPNASIARPVSMTSSPSSNPWIMVSPTDKAPSIKDRCDMDLSPGTSACPINGPDFIDFIGIKELWPAICVPQIFK